jgi:hypothetical protein
VRNKFVRSEDICVHTAGHADCRRKIVGTDGKEKACADEARANKATELDKYMMKDLRVLIKVIKQVVVSLGRYERKLKAKCRGKKLCNEEMETVVLGR